MPEPMTEPLITTFARLRSELDAVPVTTDVADVRARAHRVRRRRQARVVTAAICAVLVVTGAVRLVNSREARVVSPAQGMLHPSDLAAAAGRSGPSPATWCSWTRLGNWAAGTRRSRG